MLSETGQAEKDKLCIISLILESKKAKFIETDSRMGFTRDWEVGEMGR